MRLCQEAHYFAYCSNRSKDSRTRPFERSFNRCTVRRGQCIVRIREAITMYSERILTSIKFTYRSNNDYSLQLTRWFLMPIAAWPRATTSTTVERISLQAHVLACSSLIAVVMVPCMLYVSLEEKDVQMKLNAMGPLSHWIMGTINYWLLLTRSDDIRKCVHHMEMDWRLVRRNDDQDVMLRYAKIGRFVAGFCAIFMQSGTFLFTVAKAMTSMNVMIGNETMSVHPMTCPIYSKFIDTRFSPANEIMLAVELLSCFIVNSITVGACSLAAVFAMHAYGQLSMLFAWLNDLVEVEDNGNNFAEKKLATIVEHHLRVLSFISRMENVMQNICLVELVGCTMNMCLLAYYSITNWSNFDAARITSYIIVYVSMAFNIFIFCYIGEILTEQCKNVGEKAYMTNWYELPHKTALGLILIIARSSNVIKITAGKLFQLSIATFGDVIKTSVVYLNILRTMTPST